MNNRCISRRTLSRVLFASVLLACSQNAFAYLDPSTGSMVISAIVGILASLGLAVKTYWYKFKALFRRKSEKKAEASKASSAKE